MRVLDRPAPDSHAARRLDIDHLRNIAVLLLLVFHTARLFNAEPWHVKDSSTYLAADLVVRAMNQWHMPLLFLLAGMSLHLALARRGLAATLEERLLRLAVPLAAGMVLIVPPQVYIERITPGIMRMSPVDFAGSYVDFQSVAFDCCYPQANLSWHHLWFVAYLLVYSLALAPALDALQSRGLTPRMTAWATGGWRPFVLVVPIVMAEVLLRPRFPNTQDLIHDWANHAHYVALVVIGWAIVGNPALEAAVAGRRRANTAVAFVLAGLWIAIGLSPALAQLPLEARVAIRVTGEWACLLAFLGHARSHLDRPLGWLTAFSRYALPFYIVHQTVIVLLGRQLLGWSEAPLLKFLVVMLASGAISLAACRLLDSNPVTRLLVGLKGSRRLVSDRLDLGRTVDRGLDRQR